MRSRISAAHHCPHGLLIGQRRCLFRTHQSTGQSTDRGTSAVRPCCAAVHQAHEHISTGTVVAGTPNCHRCHRSSYYCSYCNSHRLPLLRLRRLHHKLHRANPDNTLPGNQQSDGPGVQQSDGQGSPVDPDGPLSDASAEHLLRRDSRVRREYARRERHRRGSHQRACRLREILRLETHHRHRRDEQRRRRERGWR